MIQEIKLQKLRLIIFLSIVCIVFNPSVVAAQSPIDTPTPTTQVSPTPTVSITPTEVPNNDGKIQDLQNKIKEYQGKITELQGTKKTLSSQIAIMNNQINLTELKIKDAEDKIQEIEKDIDVTKNKVNSLESTISHSTKTLLERIEASYKAGKVAPWQIFLASDTVGSFFDKLKYLRVVQISDKRKIYANEQQKVNYENQQSILESQQKEEKKLQNTLKGYTTQLNQDKVAKQQLLNVTQNDEDKYQKLLKDARAQINAFKSFTSSRVGSGDAILPAQPSPDGWYYNQRDERWGRNTIGASSDQMWEVGCLVTSTAMVLKQKGQNVTPADVAAVSSYFFSDTASMLIPWNGGKFQSVWQRDFAAIDQRLAAGDPVIVGVKVSTNSVGTHFVVLKSGSNGDYVMNDPWEGANLKFGDYYSTAQIFQYGYLK